MNKSAKHAGGRPTKYDPSFLGLIDQYLTTVGREQTKIPKRVDIALLLNVDEDTLNNWANARVKDKDGNDTNERLYPEFFGALTRVDMMQKSQLMDDGMYGGKEINPQIAKFLLEANHNMVGRSATDITSKGEKLESQTILIVEDEPHHESTG